MKRGGALNDKERVSKYHDENMFEHFYHSKALGLTPQKDPYLHKLTPKKKISTMAPTPQKETKLGLNSNIIKQFLKKIPKNTNRQHTKRQCSDTVRGTLWPDHTKNHIYAN